jgi:pimeloyl-ACP methyl ester carboxylesterase
MSKQSDALLLIPGLLCDARLWAKQTLELSDVAQCNTPDLTSCESIAQMADSVLSRAPAEFSLAGFSMGGCVALEIVARAPERVRRLVLLSSNADGLMPNVRQHYEESIARLRTGGLATYLADAFPRYIATDSVCDVPLWQTFCAMGTDLGAAVAVRQMQALLHYPGFSGDLGAITCPTLLICGDQDKRTPVAVHERLAEKIPAATLHVIRGSGHFTPIERPVEVTGALRRCLAMTPARIG